MLSQKTKQNKKQTTKRNDKQPKHEELRWKPQCPYEKFDMAVYN